VTNCDKIGAGNQNVNNTYGDCDGQWLALKWQTKRSMIPMSRWPYSKHTKTCDAEQPNSKCKSCKYKSLHSKFSYCKSLPEGSVVCWHPVRRQKVKRWAWRDTWCRCRDNSLHDCRPTTRCPCQWDECSVAMTPAHHAVTKWSNDRCICHTDALTYIYSTPHQQCLQHPSNLNVHGIRCQTLYIMQE